MRKYNAGSFINHEGGGVAKCSYYYLHIYIWYNGPQMGGAKNVRKVYGCPL